MNFLDFEIDAQGNSLFAGQFIDDEFAELGISVFGARPGESLDGTGTNRALIFDSANPTGGDTDLATNNQGNILIITEDGDQSDPDDNIGGTFVFTFDSPRSLESLGFIDTEESGGKIRAYDADQNLITSRAIPAIPDGAQQVVGFDVANVTRLEVELAGSGAISRLEFGEAELGDRVFLDADRNGIQDPNEAGVEGVTVTITGAGEDGRFGTPDDTTVVTETDANGNYSSGGLAPDDYTVTFSNLPSGFEFTTPKVGGNDAIDSDVDPSTGSSNTIRLNAGETNRDVDAGIVETILPARLGNQVFDDLNQNGIRDAGEAGVKGVTVTLVGGGEDGLLSTLDDNIEDSVVTNSRGRYSFRNLTPGEYQVTFSDLPDGFEFTAQDQGPNDARDSDANSVTGVTDVVVLESGEINNTVDAGIFLALPTPEKNLIRGTIGPDFRSGTAMDDDIRGLGDSDTLLGFGGDDCLFGAGGFDLIRGGTGADSLFGGAQNDTLFGNAGNDLLSGGTGSDRLVGGGGLDTLDGTRGSNTAANGANEIDTLIGGASGDLLILGNAADKYYLAAGDNDFALIQGFNVNQDTLQLNGSIGDYSTTINGDDLELRASGELIAVFQNTDSLDLGVTAQFV